MDMQIDNIKTIIDEARRPILIDTLPENSNPAFLVPNGFTVLDMEKLLAAPTRKRADVTMTDSDSFIYYTKKHGSLDECTIYANTDFEAQAASLVAIIDDHGSLPGAASWRNHTATYRPIKTVEWKTWNEKSAVAMSQEAFATFLEENLGDIGTVSGMPSGTEILQMATEFESNCDKRFKSRLNLQGGGVNMIFVDQENAETQSAMRVFERFALGLRVFLNGAAYRVDARLKYRNDGGRLKFWYELIRPDRVFEDAVKGEFAKIKEATGFPLLYGSAGI